MTASNSSYILTITCPDTVGIVAAVAGYLRDQNFFVEESAHFGDRDTGNFFSRTKFSTNGETWSEDNFRAGFGGMIIASMIYSIDTAPGLCVWK